NYAGTADQGLRTLSGGQLTFQINGYLAIQTGAAPDLLIDSDISIRDIYGILRTPPSGSGTTLQLNCNGSAWATVQFDADNGTSQVAQAFVLPILHAGDPLSRDTAGVGTTTPGSDLTLIIRL